MIFWKLIGFVGCLSAMCSVQALTFDFEDGSLQGWQVTSGEFGKLITDRATFHNKKTTPYNKQGKYFLSTLETKQNGASDAFQGVIQSPLMTLKGGEIKFLVGGGKNNVSFALCDEDGNVLKSVAGNNDETMSEVTWDVTANAGKKVFFRVTDKSSGGWAHITVDDIRLDADLDADQTAYWKRWIQHLSVHTTTVDSLRLAVDDLVKRYGDGVNAEPLRKLLDANPEGEALDAAALAVARAVPGLQVPILFTTRPQYIIDHHNSETLFQTNEINTHKYRPGGPMKTLNVATGKTTVVFDPGATGAARDPELSFDGKKILFSFRQDKDVDYHICEIDANGGGFRQLTEMEGVTDIDPMYLPDGDIIFASTRQPKFCMCNRHIMANLYRMGADGSNPHPIGRSTLFEGHPVLLPDGRILYDRWEYVDRNFGDAQGLWVTNPDGTNHAIYWGNNTQSPGGVIDARPIPGTQKVIAVLGSCHDRPWGALAIIDRSKGLDGPDPVDRTWPSTFRKEIMVKGPKWYDSPMQSVRKRYEDPFPLDDGWFLVSRAIDPSKYGEKTGLYLLDLFGNEILLHAEDNAFGSYDPMPVTSRPRPPVRPVMTDLSKNTGVFFLQNVYEGTHMAGVKPGEVKYLRIVESPEKRTWTKHAWAGQGEQAPGVNWHSFETKRVLGIVPVESDGSAYFEVPSDCFIYFQALDSQKRMIQSMRSGTIARPGELQGCVGCHENRLSAPPTNMGQNLATKRPPSKMNPDKEEFGYNQRVQPIWDKHCVSCHDFGTKGGKAVNLSGDLIMPFNVSYTEMWSKGQIKCIGGGPAELQPAKSWGSNLSKIVKKLDAGHHSKKLTQEERETIDLWIDLNGVYYPSYESAYPDGAFGQGPLNPGEFNKLRGLLGNKGIPAGHGFRGAVSYSFTRPEKSPALEGLDADKRAAALEILNTAKKRLEENPRADMPAFKPYDDKQLGKYDKLADIEAKIRQAIIDGKRLYDKDFQ